MAVNEPIPRSVLALQVVVAENMDTMTNKQREAELQLTC